MGFSPSVVSFGDVAATTTQTIDVVFTGASAESRSASVSGAGFSVATKETAAGSHTVTVTFSPTDVQSYSATLSFAALTPEGAPDTCSVTGTGTNPVSFSAASVAFGTLTLGDSTQRIAMVSNAGATAATLSFSGAGYNVAGNYLSIAAGAVGQSAPITFSPAAAGDQNGTLTVTLGDHQATCALVGAGQATVEEVAGTETLSSAVDNPEGTAITGAEWTASAAARVKASKESNDPNRAFRLEVPHPETTFNLGYRRSDHIKIDGFGLDTVGDGYLNACGQIGIQAAQDIFIQSTGASINSASDKDNVISAKGGSYVFGNAGVFVASIGDDPVAVNQGNLMPEGKGIETSKSQANIAAFCFNAMDAMVAGGSLALGIYDQVKTGKWDKSALPGMLSAFSGFSVSTSGALGALGVSLIPAPGVTVYGHAGVLLGTPGFGGFYAGAGLVIGSLFPLVFGAEPAMLGLKSATVRGFMGATLQSDLKAAVQGDVEIELATGLAGSINSTTMNYSSEATAKHSFKTTTSTFDMTPTNIDLETITQLKLKVGAQTVVVALDSVSLKNPTCEVTVYQTGAASMKHTSGTVVSIDATTVLAKDPSGAQLKLGNGMAEMKNAGGDKFQLGMAGATISGKAIKLG